VRDTIPPGLWLVATIGFFERATFWGCKYRCRASLSLDGILTLYLMFSHRTLAYVTASPLTPACRTMLTCRPENYMEHHRDYDNDQTPGALDLGQVKATRLFCAFFVLYFITPIFIAPLADSRLGQYKTLLLSLSIYCLGCVSLVISSLPANLERGWGVPGLSLSLVLVGLGGGGVGSSIDQHLLHMLTSASLKPL
jgi:POT family proton-dependent oligopeptide transporter